MKGCLFFTVALSVSIPMTIFAEENAEENSIDQPPPVDDTGEQDTEESAQPESASMSQNESPATSHENVLSERTSSPEGGFPQWADIFTLQQKEALSAAQCEFDDTFYSYTMKLLKQGYTTNQIVQGYLERESRATRKTNAQQDERRKQIAGQLMARNKVISDRKRLRKYTVTSASVAFGGLGAGALLMMFTGIAVIDGEFIPGLAWASYGIALASLTFGPSIGRFMAGLHGQGGAFTGVRAATSGISLTLAILATNDAYNQPVLIAGAIVSGAATLALAITDVATTRSSILNYESENGVQVSLRPMFTYAETGSGVYGLAMSGRF